MKMDIFDTIEATLDSADGNALRQRVLESAKKFKTSWIELAQALYTVWKDKLYKGWGYNTFDAYTSKEIGINKQTAMKLLRSYFFLEKEEPLYLKEDYNNSAQAASIPTYEAVDVLRRAQKRNLLDNSDYDDLKEKVLKKGQGASEVKKDLTALIRQREELEPEEAKRKREISTLKRFLSTLKSLKRDIVFLKLLPGNVLEKIDDLIVKIEDRIA
ncbi:MAG: hypothetical protein ABH836_07705 [Candidatus Omnitrophota bacterium]